MLLNACKMTDPLRRLPPRHSLPPQMAATAAQRAAGLVWVFAFLLSFSGACLVLAGLASQQSLCHNGGWDGGGALAPSIPTPCTTAPVDRRLTALPADGPIVTNSRRLLQIDPSVLLASCSKAYRFQWW